MWAFFDASGVVLGCGNGNPPPGASVVAGDITIGQLARSWLDSGEIVPRPDGPEIDSSGTTHTVTACPIGTVIEVYDLTGGEIASTFTVTVEGDDVDLIIDEAGAYRIEVAAPLPAMPTRLDVEVSA